MNNIEENSKKLLAILNDKENFRRIVRKGKNFLYEGTEDKAEIPKNGIYIFFEKGEKVGDLDRVVRVGTHTSKDGLKKRLVQHYRGKRTSSVFRKEVGKALICKESKGEELLEKWKGKANNEAEIQNLEAEVSKYFEDFFSFTVIPIADENITSEDAKEKRLLLEEEIIALMSYANIVTNKSGEWKPSEKWLGNFSPEEKIKTSGMWLKNGLYSQILTEEEIGEIKSYGKNS